MKIVKLILILAVFIGKAFAEPNLEQISRAMGHLIGKNLQSMGLTLDIDALVLGMKEGAEGEESLSEDECLQALSILQEETLLAEAEKNLREAVLFLEANAAKDGVIVLEEGKLQYTKVKEGLGNAVEPYNSPILRYKGHYLNGKIFGDSSTEEMISLDEAFQGLSKGVIGMREGEIRTLYIHPELAYGPSDLTAPNALIIFEVEVLKADASAEAQATAKQEDSHLDDASAIR